MPAVSKAQQGLAGADLARKRAGKKTRTGMSEQKLRDFARKPVLSSSKRPKKGKK